MAKIVLIALVFLAGVIIAQAVDVNLTTVAPNINSTTAPAPVDPNATTAATTAAPEVTTVAAAGFLQPMAIFVLACAFLGLLH